MRVYVAGPYSRDPIGGVRAAIEAAHALLDAGHQPYVPHTTMLLDLARHRPYEEWLALDLVWLAQCEAVLRLPGASPGADRECARARELGIKVVERVEDLRSHRCYRSEPAPERKGRHRLCHLATLMPRYLRRYPGKYLTRLAERQYLGSLFQPPPRMTR